VSTGQSVTEPDFLVRLGPPSRGDVIHRASCGRAHRAKGESIRWRWADNKGYANIDWDALRRNGIRACRHCLADLLLEPVR
jgi:hypothetical protein